MRVCKLYAPLVDANVKEVVEGSGRCTAKSTSNEIVALSLMLQDKRNNIWYCRAEKSDIRDTIFSSMISTAQLMGVDKLFSWSLSPLRVRCNRTGAICYFDSVNGKTDDDMTATKGFTPQYKTLAMCILDEADQVKHPNHITAWQSTAARFLLPNAKMVYPVVKNPPASMRDTVSIPGPGRFHRPRSNQARAPQLLSPQSRTCAPQLLSPHAATTEPLL